MRLFAGIPVPEPALSALGAVMERCRRQPWPVRWARNEGLHLTLKFYGEVSNQQRDAIEPMLTEAARGLGPIPMRCSGLGHFPPGRQAQVIWAGIEAPAALELLQDRVERGSVALGFPLEGRPYRPHITLGRVRQGERLDAAALTALQGFEEIAFLAGRIVLFESRPGAGGAVYAVRAIVEFG